MGYKYEDVRDSVFTDNGQRRFLKMRDRVKEMLKLSGAVRSEEVTRGECGDSWEIQACVDRMVELKEIIEIPQPEGTWLQHRVYRGSHE